MKRILPQLPQWTYEEGNQGDNLESAYDAVVSQLRRYAGHVAAYVGGVYITYKSVEQSGAVYEPETKTTQKAALAFIDREIFNEPTWLNVEYLNRFTQDPLGKLKTLPNGVIDRLVTASMMANMVKFATYAAEPYQPSDYVKDLVNMVFKETTTGAKVSPYRRYLQTRMVTKAITEWLANVNSDGRPYLYNMLTTIQSRVKNARGGDEITRAHYASLAQQISEAFEHPEHPQQGQTAAR